MRLYVVQSVISAEVSMLELYLPPELLLILSCVFRRIVSIAEVIEVGSRPAHILFNLSPELLIIEVA